MQQFIAKFRDQITGVISGFDRLIFRGVLRRLVYSRGMEQYLWQNQILFKDYACHVKKVSQRIKNVSLELFHAQSVPVVYLPSPKTDKDECARTIALERGVKEGLVCALTSLEPSPTFEHYGTHMVARTRPCAVLCHYWIDPEWGWMNARIQTWFPFNIQVCIKGREWLARQMEQQGLHYQRQGNCFVWLQDYPRAQQLLEDQLRVSWPETLQKVAGKLNPLHAEIFQKYPSTYYWTSYQSEWATDVVFRPGELRRLEPLLLRHGLLSFSSPDVMRFLRKKILLSGQIPGRFAGELVSDLKRRVEGDRIKHRIDQNSVELDHLLSLYNMHEQMGNYKQAMEQWTKLQQLGGSESKAKELKQAFEKSGYTGYLQKDAKDKEADGNYYEAACDYARLGEKDAAFAALEQAFAAGNNVDEIKLEPGIDTIRSDP